MTYHQGELTMQAQAGVQAMAKRIGRGIHPALFPAMQEFVEYQTFAVAASIDADGRVWASLLTGQPGFLTSHNEHTLRILALPAAGDPLAENLQTHHSLGLVVIDFATRQRVRLNGTAEMRPDGIEMTIQQAYGNCQKHIQVRLPVSEQQTPVEVGRADVLSLPQREQIGQADTLFVASYYADGGADASHRGGTPGFVRVTGPDTLEFPDYPGNSMFNTLGNIVANPRAGLLFPDFAHGSTLQLTGKATIINDIERAAVFPGAERIVEFHVEQVIEIAGAMPLRYTLIHASPYNYPTK